MEKESHGENVNQKSVAMARRRRKAYISSDYNDSVFVEAF